MPLAVGSKLGPYEIAGSIGAGGMGEVYRARDSRLQRDVAIKVLPASFASDADRLRRFEQEARVVGALNHPNIVAIYDVGQDVQGPYLVSELLQGESLRRHLDGTALPARKVIDYGMQIARGHHEKLNGLGYHYKLAAPEIPVQTRMMTISDIFDALSASDRPYKKAVSQERAIEILGFAVKDGELDPELFKVFLEAKVFEKWKIEPYPY